MFGRLGGYELQEGGGVGMWGFACTAGNITAYIVPELNHCQGLRVEGVGFRV